jgi:hypothetical protein
VCRFFSHLISFANNKTVMGESRKLYSMAKMKKGAEDLKAPSA